MMQEAATRLVVEPGLSAGPPATNDPKASRRRHRRNRRSVSAGNHKSIPFAI